MFGGGLERVPNVSHTNWETDQYLWSVICGNSLVLPLVCCMYVPSATEKKRKISKFIMCSIYFCWTEKTASMKNVFEMVLLKLRHQTLEKTLCELTFPAMNTPLERCDSDLFCTNEKTTLKYKTLSIARPLLCVIYQAFRWGIDVET